MGEEPAAAERRRQRANTALVVAGCCTARGLMEAAYVYATRGVLWRRALLFTLPSWMWLAPLATATVMLASRFPFERRNRRQSVVVHALACGVFGIVHIAASLPSVSCSRPRDRSPGPARCRRSCSRSACCSISTS